MKSVRVFGWIFIALALLFLYNEIDVSVRYSNIHEVGVSLGLAISRGLVVLFSISSLPCMWPYKWAPKSLPIIVGFWWSILLIVLHVLVSIAGF